MCDLQLHKCSGCEKKWTERTQTLAEQHPEEKMMMMMMKNPVVLVTCTLLLSSLALASQTSFSPDECCFQFRANRLPKKNVMSYKYTDNRCPKAGLLFTMRTGGEICVEPKTDWVQVIVKTIDRVKAKAAASTTPRRSE